MRVARYWLRAELRQRWRGWLGLAVLIGVVSGALLTGLAGARRTDSAYQRFLDDTSAYDLGGVVDCGAGDHVVSQRCTERIASLPGVDDVATLTTFGAQFAPVRGQPVQLLGDPCYSDAGVVQLVGDRSGRYGTELNRLEVVEGRPAEPGDPREVVISRELSRRLDVHPGDALGTALVPYDDCLEDPAGWPPYEPLEVVGVAVAAGEVRPPAGFFINTVVVTPAFVRAHEDAAATGGAEDVAFLRLDRRDPGAVDALVRDAGRVGITIQPAVVQADYARDLARALDPQSLALRLVAVVGAVAALAVLVQALARQTAVESVDLPILGALGCSRAGRWLLGLGRALVIGAGAAVVAVAVGYLGSWWTPLGIARVVEPDPGFSFDLRVLGPGAGLTALAVVLAAAGPAWRAAGFDADRPGVVRVGRPSRLAAAVGRSGASPALVGGVRMALEPGRGRTAVPVRSGLVAVGVGIGVVAGALTFGSSLSHLLHTPRLVGVGWDLRLAYPDPEETGVRPSDVTAALGERPEVAGFSFGTFFSPLPGRGLEVGKARVEAPLMSFDAAGTVQPSLIEGRAPTGPGEVLLGPSTAEDADVDVGDRVTLWGQAGEWERPETFEDLEVRMVVVGTGVVPQTGGAGLGNGATVTLEGLERLSPGSRPDSVFVRLRDGVDPVRFVTDLAAGLGVPDPEAMAREAAAEQGFVLLDVASVDRLPLALGALMAVMAVGVLLHVLVSGTRTRRRDLAVLRTIGFDRHQTRATVGWQAITVAFLAAAVGLPLGVVVGRAAWLVFADRINVVPEPVVAADVLLVLPAALVAAVAAAAGPAAYAAWRRPALDLRAE